MRTRIKPSPSPSKAAADHFVRAWMATYGLPVVLSNASNNYGPFQYPEKLVPGMITIAGRPFPEIDRVEWVSPDQARLKLNPAQGVFIDRLLAHLAPPREQ